MSSCIHSSATGSEAKAATVTVEPRGYSHGSVTPTHESIPLVERRLPGGLTLELTPESEEKQGLGLWTLGLVAACWASSQEGRRELAGRRVLELGSGVGLAGLACGVAASDVTLTDYDDDVLAKLRRHVELNQSRLQPTTFTVLRLDWDAAPVVPPISRDGQMLGGAEPEPEPELPDDLQEVLGTPARQYDIILGADCCYSGMARVPDLFASSDDTDSDSEQIHSSEEEDAPPALQAKRLPRKLNKLSWDNSANVAQTLAWCMARPHGVAHLFVHEGRSPDEVAKFVSRAEKLGMSVVERVALLQRDFFDDTCNVPAAPGTDIAATASTTSCMHNYTQESGLVRLKVRWRKAGE